MDKVLDAPGVYFSGVRDLTDYQPNVPGTIAFIPFISKKGEANSIKYITSAQNLVREYGEPDMSLFGKFGQGLMNAIAYASVSGSLYAMRVLPEDAEYANAYLDLLDLSKEHSVKNFTKLAPESETMSDDMVSKNLGLLPNIKGKQFSTNNNKYLLFFETGKVYESSDLIPETATESELLNMYKNSVQAEFVYDELTDGSTVTINGTQYTIVGNPLNVTNLVDGVDVCKPMLVLLPKAQGDFYNRYFVRFTEKSDEEDRLYLDIYEKEGLNYKIIESFVVSLYPLDKDNQGDSIFIKDVLENYSDVLRAEFNYTLNRQDAINTLRETLLDTTIPLTKQDSLIRYVDQLPIEKVNGVWKSIFTEDKTMTFVTDDYADEDALRNLHAELVGPNNTLDSYKGIKIEVKRTTETISNPQPEILEIKYFEVDNGDATNPVTKYALFFIKGSEIKLNMYDTDNTQTSLSEDDLIDLFNSLTEIYDITFPGQQINNESFEYDGVTYYFKEDKSSDLSTSSITVTDDTEIQHSIVISELPVYKLVEFTSDIIYPLSGEVEYSYTKGIYSVLDNGVLRKFDPFGFVAEYVGMISLQNGSDGSLWDPVTGKLDVNVATDTLVKAYSGKLDADKDNQFKVTDKFGTYFTLVFDANYPKPVKDAIVNLVDNLRDDCVAILDMEMTSSITDAKKKRRSQYSYNTQNAVIYDNPYKMYDEYTGAYYWVTPTYAMARILPSVHQSGFLWSTPAGLRRGSVSGVYKLKYIPANNEELSLLTEDQINPIIKLPEGYYVWGQRTALKTPSVMQNLYAVMVQKYAYRAINTFLKFYPFEYNTQETWNDVKAQVSSFMNDLQIQGGIESYKLEVSATDYELKQRMFHVYVEMSLPEIAEKVVFSIGVSN